MIKLRILSCLILICFSFSCCQKQLSNENELENAKNVINEFKDLDLYKFKTGIFLKEMIHCLFLITIKTKNI
jgi:hypothetical protein